MISKIRKTASSVTNIGSGNSRTVFTGYNASKVEKFKTRGIAHIFSHGVTPLEQDTEEIEGCGRPLEWLARVEDGDGGSFCIER